MGQEESRMVDESTPTETLKARTVEAVAEHLKAGRVRRVVVMVGAGISTSAGIPDFRSPDTGLYANLARLDIPFAEAVFDISYFRQNPLPFYTLAHELYPGRYKPTVAHSFIRLLHEKGLLLKLFTQNIDCLEREAGVPDEKIIEAHGSFARQSCIECKTPYPDEDMHAAVRNKEVPHCPSCKGLIKPDIVFFGEQLPEAFINNRHLPRAADLCIVMGTSLTVQPFASLPELVGKGTPRVLVNKEVVGDLGCRADDVLLLGECDSGVRKFADALGWRDELEALWKATGAVDAGDQDKPPAERTRESVAAEVDRLTVELDETLNLHKEHIDSVKDRLGRMDLKASGGAKAEVDREAAQGSPEANKMLHEDIRKGGEATESLLPAKETSEALLHEHAGTDTENTAQADNAKAGEGSGMDVLGVAVPSTVKPDNEQSSKDAEKEIPKSNQKPSL